MSATTSLPFDDLVADVSAGNNKVQQKDYLRTGNLPIIDQGQNFISGYSNSASDAVQGDGPWIVFGDHTRTLKFVDYSFCMGADGVKLLKPRSNKQLEVKYLYHFLAAHPVPSAGYSRHFKFLRRLVIPLPPTNEQRRIALILDKADALRRKRQRVVDRLNDLRQAVFSDMFGDPSSNLKGLRKGIVGDLIESTQYGTSAKAGSVGAYPILRMGNIDATGNISTDDLKYIDLNGSEISRYTLQKGDILFNRTNSVDLVGKTAVFDRDETYAFAGYIVRARAQNHVSPAYISGYLNSTHGKKTLRGMAKSIVGMANINAREMQTIPILIPSEAEQMQYQRRVEVIDHRIGEQRKSLVGIDTLFASLQHRAFTGQL